jgi:hypothetical protein
VRLSAEFSAEFDESAGLQAAQLQKCQDGGFEPFQGTAGLMYLFRIADGDPRSIDGRLSE